jgi:hypothetical protein
MGRNWAHLPFERYADDIIVHCRTEGNVRKSVESRDSRVTHSTTPFSV